MKISKHILLIMLNIILALAVVGFLAWRGLEPISKNSIFSRTFINSKVDQIYVMPNDGLMGISGYTQKYIFFQTNNPSLILRTDYTLQKRDTINLHIPPNDRIGNLFSTYIDSPYVTLLIGRLSLAIEKNLNTNEVSILNFPTTLFTRGMKIRPNQYIIRGVDTLVKRFDQIFIKANSSTKEILKEKNISETNKDAGLSTDGIFTRNSKHNLVFYTEFYSKNFICLDTNLNLVYKGNTIDNTLSFPIKSTINKHVLTASTPKRTVNVYCDSYDDIFYVYSGVKANNETEIQKKNCPIDMYKATTGNYIGTFHIPMYKNEKIRRFRILKDKVFAFYKSNIVCYVLLLQNKIQTNQ
jgi:hypothetical protein